MLNVSGGQEWALNGVFTIDVLKFGLMGYAALWVTNYESIAETLSRDPPPLVDLLYVLTVGGTPEPDVYGSWKAPKPQSGGRAFQIQGTAYEQLAIYSRMPNEATTAKVSVWTIVVAAKLPMGRSEVTYGRYMMPGK